MSSLRFFILVFSFNLYGGAEVGLVSLLKGEAHAVRGGVEVPLEESSSIHEGDTIVTGEKAIAKVLYDDNSMQTIRGNSKIQVNSVSSEEEGSSYFTLLYGKLKSVVGARKNKQEYKLEAGDVSLGVRGTKFNTEKEEGSEEVIVEVLEGVVEITEAKNEEEQEEPEEKETQETKELVGKEVKVNKVKNPVKAKATRLSAGSKTKTSRSKVEKASEVEAMTDEDLEEVDQEDQEVETASTQTLVESQGETDTGVSELQDDINEEYESDVQETDAVVEETATATEEVIQNMNIEIQASVRSLVTSFEDIK